MSTTVPAAGNRYGTWALTLSIVGIVALFAPAAVVVVLLGTAVSIIAVVLGIRGLLAVGAGRATNRPQSIAGIGLGVLGTLLWLTALLGVLVGV
ncbi:hypothetical protein [Georgenia sp. H159]|uniref:hypothetical protein n=1 Tax=Georgenia sp. H159 TaxID=3076115 RepID=UPI002D790786|nr:hypothetical protein [Georgenia sp. H159]